MANLHVAPASAHPATNFYFAEWPVDSTVPYVFDNNVPSGGFRDAVAFGLGRWADGAGGHGPDFVRDGEITATNDFDPCTGNRSRIFVREDLGSALGSGSESILGYTPTCLVNRPEGSVVVQFSMILEKTAELGDAIGWYAGSGTPASNKWDLRSIATHESGHATGWSGHFATTVTCPNPPVANPEPPSVIVTHSMCSGNAAVVGTTMLRSLEEHDLHTYRNAY